MLNKWQVKIRVYFSILFNLCQNKLVHQTAAKHPTSHASSQIHNLIFLLFDDFTCYLTRIVLVAHSSAAVFYCFLMFTQNTSMHQIWEQLSDEEKDNTQQL